MYQKKSDILAIKVTCPDSVIVGQVVVISGDNTVAAISAAGSLTVVGTVVQHLEDATTCVVETKFRERRDDRVSGAAIAVGPFVWNAAGKAIAYDSESHDSAAIAGLCIKAASAADQTIETLEY